MADISRITLPSGTTYNLKDTVARAAMAGTITLIGTTTTALTDECTTNPIKVGGEDVVGLGSDYDGISSRRLQIKDPSYAPLLWETLVKRGLTEEQADKVFYKNVKRVFKEIIK